MMLKLALADLSDLHFRKISTNRPRLTERSTDGMLNSAFAIDAIEVIDVATVSIAMLKSIFFIFICRALVSALLLFFAHLLSMK